MNKIEISNLTRSRIDQKFLRKIAERVFKIVKLKQLQEISLVIVGDARIKALNKKYRGENRITDVLAFDYGRLPGDLPKRQGEIIICLPQARRQAKELGHSLKEELTTLLVHGILHLAGYNDKTRKEKDKMMKKQNWLIASLG